MSADLIAKLYANYEQLNSAEDKTKHEREFREILDAANQGDKEKRLAVQFIPKFFKHFPSLTEEAIDKILDLCEDDDTLIRRMAIKELPAFCKDTKENTPRISDILAQLLNASDHYELLQVNNSLQALSKLDPLGTVAGLFAQITNGDETTRLKCLQYISEKFVKGGSEIFTKETEELIINETKKLLLDVTADEFQQCIQILKSTKLGKTITGHQELVKLCMEQADLEAELESDAANDEIVDIFSTCAGLAMPFFSSQIETTPFVKFACEKFFPLSTWHLIGATDGDPAQTQLRLLKVFAELCSHCGTLDKPKEKIEAIFNVLLEFLPPPPADLENLENTPSILFSHVECLLYSIHAIGKQAPEFLAFKEQEDKLKDFRARLQFLARGTQGYVKKLQDEIKAGKVSDQPKTEEDKMKVIGLNTTSNIQTLIRDLYHPSYKAVVRLSWIPAKTKTAIKVEKKETETATPTAGTKRHAPITFSNGNNKSDGNRNNAKQARHSTQSVYSPSKVAGKFSSRFGNSQRNGNGGGGGRGGRNFSGGNRQGNRFNNRGGKGFNNRNRR